MGMCPTFCGLVKVYLGPCEFWRIDDQQLDI
jgi:hypothetical protein